MQIVIQTLKLVLFTAFTALLTISLANSHQPTQTENWLEFCPSKQLCFEHPANLIPADVQMIDSLAGQLESPNILLNYDLGLYASRFEELSTASSEPIIINGYQGKVLIEKNKMALSIQSLAGKMGFAMLIEFKNTYQLEQGRRIFKSVKFNL